MAATPNNNTPRVTVQPAASSVGRVAVNQHGGISRVTVAPVGTVARVMAAAGPNSLNTVTVGVGGVAGVQSFNGRAGIVVLTSADLAGNMPLATNSTAGAVIVGANLTVANGVLSANIPSVSSDWANITGKPSLVNTFNTRSGDVTLQASDVTSITAGLYQPTFTNITTGSNLTVVNANGTANISVTGWTSNSTDSRGVGYLTLGLGEPTVGATYRDTVGGNVTAVGSLKVNYGGSLAYSGKASEPNGTTTMSGLASLSLFPARASTIAGGTPTNVYGVSASTNDGAGNQTSVLQQHRLRLNSTAGTYQTFQGKIQSNNGTFSGYDLTACVTPSNTSLTFTAASDKPIVWTANSLLIQSYADSRYQAAGSYLTAANLTFANITGKPTTLAGYGITDGITSATAAATYLPIANFTYANLTGTPTLATVATSGNYNDLSNKPAAYTLPTATNSTMGGIIVGSNLTIANGVLSATSAGGVTTAKSIAYSLIFGR